MLIALVAIQCIVCQSIELDTQELQEVVVTAKKFNDVIENTTKQFSLIDQTLPIKNASPTEILNNFSTLFINGSYAGLGSIKTIRNHGLPGGNMLILIDGRAMYDPLSVNNDFDIRRLSNLQVEKIEILPGNQSVLYGSQASTGVINIITQKNNQRDGGNLNIEVGSQQSTKVSWQSNHHISSTLIDLRVQQHSSDGFSEAEPVEGKEYDKDAYSNLLFQMNSKSQLTNSLTWQNKLSASLLEGDYDRGPYQDGIGQYDLNMQSFDSRLERKQKDLSMFLSLNADRIASKYDDEYGQFSTNGHNVQIEAFASKKLSNTLSTDIGIHFLGQRFHEEATMYSEEKSNHLKAISPYMLVNFAPLKYYNVSIGGRWVISSDFADQPVFNLSQSVQFTDHLRMNLDWSKGYKMPTLFQLSRHIDKTTQLKPEKTNSFLIGFSFGDVKKLRGRITYFSHKLEDLIRFGADGSTHNIDRQNTKGIEIETQADIIDRWFLKCNYTYHKYHNPDPKQSVAFQNPKHLFKATIGYKLNKWSFWIVTQAMSERIDQYFDNNFVQHEVNLPNRIVQNTELRWNIAKNHELSVKISNIWHSRVPEYYGYSTFGKFVQIASNIVF